MMRLFQKDSSRAVREWFDGGDDKGEKAAGGGNGNFMLRKN